MEKVNELMKISILSFLYWNYLSKKVIRNGKGKIIPYRGSIIKVGKNSKIILHDGNFHINNNRPNGSNAQTNILLWKNSTLEIQNTLKINYNSTIELHDNAVIDIDSGYFNCGCVILAEKMIKIGSGANFAREIYVYDSDHHSFLNESGEKTNPAKEVVIGNHVWIGLKSVILRGTKIGDGVVVAACSMVGGKIKEGTMAQGNPARSYSNVIWKV